MVENLYKVPRNQWKKWDDRQRSMFNMMNEFLLDHQEIMNHPEAPVLHPKHWDTIAWNAAWMAADYLREVD